MPPLRWGRVPPSKMNEREWATFISQAGIQADNSVKTFTPTWGGFSADPVGDISYMDFGAIVIMWWNGAGSLVGTSDDSVMNFSGMPAAIRPSAIRMTSANYLVDNSGGRQGHARINTNGSVDFFINLAVNDGGTLYVAPEMGWFHNTSGKGLGAGWLVVFPK